MQTTEERIEEIEDEIRKTPYHKGTEHHIGKLKARIAKLREEEFQKSIRGGSGGGGGYAVAKTGDASVVFFGPPSVGKSTLLNKLTNAQSKVGAYDFTTLDVIPGMMDYKGAKIQIFDVPGIVEGAAKGKGRGKQVLSVARAANLIVIMVDVKTTHFIEKLKNELYQNGVRLDEIPPRVTITKQLSGGLKVNSTVNLSISFDTIKSLAGEFHLPNAEITIKENVTIDRLIDSFMGNRVYLPYLVIINKVDLGFPKNLQKSLSEESELILISAQTGDNMEKLRESIWEKLNFIRIYLKEGDEIDYNSPFIAQKNWTLKDLIDHISICNKDTFTEAKVSGPGAKFPGQEVCLTFVPQDETVVQFI